MPRRIYLSNRGLCEIYRSDDQGETWTWKVRGLPRLFGGAFAVDSQDPNLLYACSTLDQFYRSTDGGDLWERVLGDGPPIDLWKLLIQPQNHLELLAAAGDYNEIYRSEDGGVTWILSNDGFTAYSRVQELLSHPQAPYLVHASTWGGIYRSMDFGEHWTEVFGEGGLALAWAASNVHRLYAAAGTSNILRSDDAGETFTLLSFPPRRWIGGLAVDPNDPNIVLAAATEEESVYGYAGPFLVEILKSTNAGVSWSVVGTAVNDCPFDSPGGVQVGAIGYAPNSSKVVYLGAYLNGADLYGGSCGDLFYGFRRNENGGFGQWIPSVSGLGGLSGRMALDSEGNGYIHSAHGFYVFDRRANSWSEDENFREHFDGWSLVETNLIQVNSKNPEVLLAVGDTEAGKYGGPFVLVKRVHGGPWHSLEIDYYANKARGAMQYGDGNRIYYWTEHRYSHEVEMYRSAVEWDDFEEFDAEFLPKAAFLDPEDDFRLFALKDGADPIQLSTDGGINWENRSGNLPPGVMGLRMDPNDGDHLLAGFEQGAPWRTLNGGLTWEEVPIAFAGTVVSFDWDPTGDNVFVCTSIDGVVSSRWGVLNQGLPEKWVAGTGAIAYSPADHSLSLSAQGGTYRFNPGMRISAPVLDRTLEIVPGDPKIDLSPRSAAIHLSPNPWIDGEVHLVLNGLEGPVSVEIRDVRGRVVRSLLSAADAVSARRLEWDGRDQEGKLVAAGVYFVRATSKSGGVAVAKICRQN